MPKVRVIEDNGKTRRALGVFYITDLPEKVKETKKGVYYLEVKDENDIPHGFERIDDIEKYASDSSIAHTYEAHLKKLQLKYIEMKKNIEKLKESMEVKYNFGNETLDKEANDLKQMRLVAEAESIKNEMQEFKTLIAQEKRAWSIGAPAKEKDTAPFSLVGRQAIGVHESTSTEDIGRYGDMLDTYEKLMDKFTELTLIPIMEKQIEDILSSKYNNSRFARITRKQTVTRTLDDGSIISEQYEPETIKEYINRLIENGKININGHEKAPVNQLEYIDFLKSLLDELNRTKSEDNEEKRENLRDSNNTNKGKGTTNPMKSSKPVDTKKIMPAGKINDGWIWGKFEAYDPSTQKYITARSLSIGKEPEEFYNTLMEKTRKNAEKKGYDSENIHVESVTTKTAGRYSKFMELFGEDTEVIPKGFVYKIQTLGKPKQLPDTSIDDKLYKKKGDKTKIWHVPDYSNDGDSKAGWRDSKAPENTPKDTKTPKGHIDEEHVV